MISDVQAPRHLQNSKDHWTENSTHSQKNFKIKRVNHKRINPQRNIQRKLENHETRFKESNEAKSSWKNTLSTKV